MEFKGWTAPRSSWGAVLAFILVGNVGLPAMAQDNALAILRAMSDYVGSQKTIRARFDSDLEVITPQLEKIQFANSGEVELSRPDKMRVHRIGGYADVETTFDGTTVSLLYIPGNRYATLEAPGSLDELIDRLQQTAAGLPGADLLLANSYDVLAADVIEAKHIGVGVVNGVICEHLAFRNLDTDWQLWVRAGDSPSPCKMVITSKTLAGGPQYTVTIRSFEPGVDLGDEVFAFAPPEGATMVKPGALSVFDELPPSADAQN